MARAGLREDDRALVEREPGLPGLALVLDEGAFAAALDAALPEVGFVTVHAEYVRYKPRTSCLVGFVAEDSWGRRTRVYARAHRADDAARLRSGRRAAPRARPSAGSGAVLGDQVIAVHVFPADRRLRNLRRVVSGRDAVTLRYKPERRWVGRIGDRVVRVYTSATFPHAARAARALVAADEALRPRKLRVDERRGTISTAWVDGVPLGALLGTADAARAARAAGEALAMLHAARAPALAWAMDRAQPLGPATRAIGALAPELRRRAHRLHARLAIAPSPDRVLAPTHGDFSADQAIVGPAGVRLVDLDAAALGDPVDDVASFAADLEVRACAGTLAPAAARETLAALLEGHGGVEFEPPRLAHATARALVLHAADPFRARHPAWRSALERALTRAEELAPETAGAERRRHA